MRRRIQKAIFPQFNSHGKQAIHCTGVSDCCDARIPGGFRCFWSYLAPALGQVFILLLVPETKGKFLEELKKFR